MAAVGTSTSSAEQAVADMVLAAQQILQEAQQATAEPAALASRLHELQAEFDGHWAIVRDAAAALDEGTAETASSMAECAPSPEADALMERRRLLHSTLAARNQTLKKQIDQLRQSLCSIHLMDAPQ